MSKTTKPILILDYSTDGNSGAQIRRWFSIPTAVQPVKSDEPFPLLAHSDFSAVIHSGSALSIVDDPVFIEDAMAFIRSGCDFGIPQMGICYGHQLLARATVGRAAVGRAASIEMGWLPVEFLNSWPVPGFAGVKTVWQSHYDCVRETPPGSDITATNRHTEVQAFLNRSLKLFGTQFHPEFDAESGNRCYAREAQLFEKEGINLAQTLKNSPGFNAGEKVLAHFLEAFGIG